MSARRRGSEACGRGDRFSLPPSGARKDRTRASHSTALRTHDRRRWRRPTRARSLCSRPAAPCSRPGVSVGAIRGGLVSGRKGGRSIARVLFGQVNPSAGCRSPSPQPGPVPKPQAAGLGAHPTLDGPQRSALRRDLSGRSRHGFLGTRNRGLTPQGIRSATAVLHALRVRRLEDPGGRRLTVSFTDHTGPRSGAEVAESVSQPPGSAYRRLVGFTKVALKPGETRRVSSRRSPAPGRLRHRRRWLACQPAAYAYGRRLLD